MNEKQTENYLRDLKKLAENSAKIRRDADKGAEAIEDARIKLEVIIAQLENGEDEKEVSKNLPELLDALKVDTGLSEMRAEIAAMEKRLEEYIDKSLEKVLRVDDAERLRDDVILASEEAAAETSKEVIGKIGGKIEAEDVAGIKQEIAKLIDDVKLSEAKAEIINKIEAKLEESNILLDEISVLIKKGGASLGGAAATSGQERRAASPPRIISGVDDFVKRLLAKGGINIASVKEGETEIDLLYPVSATHSGEDIVVGKVSGLGSGKIQFDGKDYAAGEWELK